MFCSLCPPCSEAPGGYLGSQPNASAQKHQQTHQEHRQHHLGHRHHRHHRSQGIVHGYCGCEIPPVDRWKTRINIPLFCWAFNRPKWVVQDFATGWKWWPKWVELRPPRSAILSLSAGRWQHMVCHSTNTGVVTATKTRQTRNDRKIHQDPTEKKKKRRSTWGWLATARCVNGA